MTSRRQPSRRAHADALTALLGLTPALPGAWYTSASNIAMQPVLVRAADTEWRVHLHAYAVRSHLTEPRKVQVTVGITISADRILPRRARKDATGWQQSSAERLAELGYKALGGAALRARVLTSPKTS
jgi:hypothetical protein